MSEFSASYHLRATDRTKVEELIKSSGHKEEKTDGDQAKRR
ncbi:hypothetical protein ACX1C1_19790 [Paenibacillus sp. strain BS8-2]